MRARQRLTALFLVALLSGCEQVVELGTLPFEEKLVVRAVLQADSAVEVYFTRTFSLNQTYSPEQGVIDNVDASIVNDGISYPLTYAGQVVRGRIGTGFARYTANLLVAKPNKVYELFAKWNGHQLHATTIVPDSTVIDTAFAILDSTQGYYYGNAVYNSMVAIRPSPNLAYFVQYQQLTNPYYYTFFSIGPKRTTSTGEQLIFDPTFYLPPKWEDSLQAVVYCFDHAFYDYFRTRSNSYGISSIGIFGDSPGNVIWNVEGEAIGMFIGTSVSKKKVFVP